MSNIVGVSKNKNLIYPIIEILGPPDIGKKHVASLVAKKIFGEYISFPILTDFKRSYSSRFLFDFLQNNPEWLEANPLVWTHMYASNLIEQKRKLIELAKKFPVVVTNYTLSFKLWSSALDIKDIKNFLGDIPQSNLGYAISAPEWNSSQNIPIDFSPYLKLRLKSSYYGRLDKRIKKIYMPNERYKFQSLNKLATIIVDDIVKKYKLETNMLAKYTIDDFPKL